MRPPRRPSQTCDSTVAVRRSGQRQLDHCLACRDVAGLEDNACSAQLRRFRFPAEITGYAVWLYFHFPPGLRHVEEILDTRGSTSAMKLCANGVRWSPSAGSSALCVLIIINHDTQASEEEGEF